MTLRAMFVPLFAVTFLSGCGDTVDSKVISVYSPHGVDLEGDIKARFEAAHPGWTVHFVDKGGGEIYAKVSAEKSRPGASVWWGGAVSDFKRAEAEGLLEPYTPAWSASLPDDAKSSTGGWSATFLTPEIILYNPKKIAAADVPADWEGLADPKWKGRLVIRDVQHSAGMKFIFGCLILREKARRGSVDAGFDFLKKLDANCDGQYAPNPDILYKRLEDDGPIAISPWNLPDAYLQKKKGRSLDFVIPKETMVNVEPIALIKNAPNPEGAKLFYDFVNSPEQLVLMAKERDRIPARNDIPRLKLTEAMRDLKHQPMKFNRAEFDENIEEWMYRWDTTVKGKGAR